MTQDQRKEITTLHEDCMKAKVIAEYYIRILEETESKLQLYLATLCRSEEA